jgi:uncharacterized protein (TIGR02145 family)
MRKIQFLLLLFIVVQVISCQHQSSEEKVEQTELTIDIASIKIGNQVWMAENLSVSHYQNGDPISMLEPDDFWRQTTEGAWSYYNNDSANFAKCGKLYNWHAVNDDRKICPKGWRMPDLKDFATLIEFLGTDSTAGHFLKLRDSAWVKNHPLDTNTVNFSALPAGYRLTNGEFLNFGVISCFWTSTPGDNNNAWDVFILGKSGMVGKSQTGFEHGFSCRCLKE